LSSQKFQERPIVFKILMILCLVIAAVMIFSFLRSLRYSPHIVIPSIKILLWLGVCFGFYRAQKWAWAAFAVLVSFSVLNTVNFLISQREGLHAVLFISMAAGGAILWCLNRKDIRKLFEIDLRKGHQSPVERANFTVLSITIGLFILAEILGMRYIVTSSAPTRLFFGFIGIIYVLLGIGVWQLNKSALNAALSFLIFSAISIAIILGYDFIKANRFLALQKSLFYILISVGMLFYWARYVRPKISKDD
jgi:hypothetical protein